MFGIGILNLFRLLIFAEVSGAFVGHPLSRRSWSPALLQARLLVLTTWS